MKIRTAYEAFWFIHEHPKLNCFETVLADKKTLRIETKAARSLGKELNVKLTAVRRRFKTLKDECDGKKYRVMEYLALDRNAIDCNLDIFWAKVDGRRRVNKDKAKNTFTECWLELGPIYFVVTNGSVHLQHSHDVNLDCGAPTFDEALIKLARKVRKHYGDIKTLKWMGA